MTRLLFIISVFACAETKAQRTVVHVDLIPQMQANTEYKIQMNNMYERKLNDVKENRSKILAYATTIEEIQRKTYNALTNVDAAIRNGKTLIYISKKIPEIFSNLTIAAQLASGKPYLATVAADQSKVIIERVVKLQTYLNDFVLKDDPKTLINPTDRAKFVHEIYQNIIIIHSMSNALINTFKLYNLQDAINKVVPYQMYLNMDKIILQDIIKKVRL